MNLSLRHRFFTATAIVTVVVMLVSFLIIDISYRKQWRAAVEETLQLHVFSLLSVSYLSGEAISLPDISYNPRFNTSDSGLWAAVFNNNGQLLWHSLSIATDKLPVSLSESTGDWKVSEAEIQDHQYVVMAYQVQLDIDNKQQNFHFVAAQERAELDRQIFNARMQLLAILLVVALLLSTSQFIGLGLAFKPIARLENEISKLDDGQLLQLSDDYPPELHGVSSNLNNLIEKETQLRERYRSNMADFAHSLKTPVAIIRNEIADSHNQDLDSAITRIDSAIEYQLRRAVISDHSLIKKGTDFAAILTQVLSAMHKIYQDKNVVVSVDTPEPVTFAGDENELMEILGNLLDNAFKYAERKIHVTARKLAGAINIRIEDDGPGFAQSEYQSIFKRGTRLDNRGLGQGIGLAVVVDMVEQYHGSISAGRSDLGGALFEINIPGT